MAKILIADDNSVCRTVLSILLTNQGHQVTQAHDGQEAIVHLEREGFDLMLLDHEMPHVSGMDVLKRVREECALPAIIVSGTVSQALSEEYARLGVSGIYKKPVDPKTLRVRIDALLAPNSNGEIVTKSDAQRALEAEIDRVKNFPATLTLLGNAKTPFKAIIGQIVGQATCVETKLPEFGSAHVLNAVSKEQVIVIPSAAELSDDAQMALCDYVGRPAHARVILCVTSSIELLEDLGFSQKLLMRFGTRCLEIPEDVTL